MNNMVTTDKRPCFFKIFLPRLSTEQLRIPPYFRKHILKDLSSRHQALLHGPSGGIWKIGLIKIANDIFLKNGWQEFARDHKLGNSEFLLVTYEGNLRFRVQIFDRNGMERVNMSDPGTHQQPIVPESSQLARLKRTPGVSCSQNTKLYKLDLPFEETNIRCEKGKDIGMKSRRVGKTVLLPETNSTEKLKNAADQKTSTSFTSEYPFFERRLKTYNVQRSLMLAIPTLFARKYLPREKTRMILQNQKGETWELKYTPDGSTRALSGGWAAFVRDNNRKEDDICIFEVVGKTEMKVHIFHSGSHPL